MNSSRVPLLDCEDLIQRVRNVYNNPLSMDYFDNSSSYRSYIRETTEAATTTGFLYQSQVKRLEYICDLHDRIVEISANSELRNRVTDLAQRIIDATDSTARDIVRRRRTLLSRRLDSIRDGGYFWDKMLYPARDLLKTLDASSETRSMQLELDEIMQLAKTQ